MVMARQTSASVLIDELGKINSILVPYETMIKRRDQICKLIKERITDDYATGQKYEVHISTSIVTILDQQRIKAEMPSDWVDKYSRESARRSLTCQKKIVAKRVARR